MSKLPEFFKSLKLNKFYKVLLYIFSIILILSFINVDIANIRITCYWFIFASIGLWILEELFFNVIIAFAIDELPRKEQSLIIFLLFIVYYFIQFIVLVFLMTDVLHLF